MLACCLGLAGTYKNRYTLSGDWDDLEPQLAYATYAISHTAASSLMSAEAMLLIGTALRFFQSNGRESLGGLPTFLTEALNLCRQQGGDDVPYVLADVSSLAYQYNCTS